MMGLSRVDAGSSGRAPARWVLFVGLFAVLVGMLSACSGSEEEDAGTAVATPEFSVVPTVPADPTRTPAVGLQVEVLEDPDPNRAPVIQLTNAGRQDERLVVRVVPPGSVLLRPDMVTLKTGRSAEVALVIPPVGEMPPEVTVEVRDLESGQVLASIEVAVPER